MSADVKTKNWGAGPMKFPYGSFEMKPTELHMLEAGSLDNKPSFAFVSTIPGVQTYQVVSQISLAMLDVALQELGYRIVPKENSPVSG